MDNVYFTLDMHEISKHEYDAAHRRKHKLLMDKPFGFVLNVNNTLRTAYLNHNGKYYTGDLDVYQTYRDMEDFTFLGVRIRPPEAVFKRKMGKLKAVS